MSEIPAHEYNDKPDQEMTASIKNIRELHDLVRLNIYMHVPEGREKSIALTKLEECAMWAIKGITHA